METSSPLAAIRPAAPLLGDRDGFAAHPHSRLSANPLAASALHMRDQFNFPRSRTDYFNVKSVRGSSPTTSLAADLSQNFSITEASPHFPTPRRALFTTATIMEAIGGREYITTPPLAPSSSPAALNEMMDVSPLPHKTPFLAHIEIPSPTPVQSLVDEIMVESPAPRQVSLEPTKPVLVDRRKLALRRPSLSRQKGFSTGAVPTRPHIDGSVPLFQFGLDTRSATTCSSMSLSECFQESPPQERRPQTSHSPCATAVAVTRAKPQFASLSGLSSGRTGSPIGGHSRRPSNPFMRPRKQFRRSLSMFEHPGDVMKPKNEETLPISTLQAVADIEEAHEPILPHFFPEGQNDSIPRISRCTMLEVLDGQYSDKFDHKMVVDCRFEYEYEGGHINGAINYNDKELLTSHLFGTPMQGRTLLIFHCEYSAHRAPIMARHVRAADRSANAEHYPRLTYPEVYILDGGYSGFFADHRDRCYPQAYVEMHAAEHVHTCEREMGRLRNNRKGLHRAQTFAFGQHERSVENSPTAPIRASSREEHFDIAMLGASPVFGSDRVHARRMASY